MSYTSSGAQTSQGVLLQVDSAGGSGGTGGQGSPPSWVTVGELVDGGFSDKLQFDDSTNTQSLAKEFLATLPDPGKFSGTINRVSTDPGQAILVATRNANPSPAILFRVTFPINTAAGQTTRGDVRQFLAYVESISPDIKVDKKISSKLSLQITNSIIDIEGA